MDKSGLARAAQKSPGGPNDSGASTLRVNVVPALMLISVCLSLGYAQQSGQSDGPNAEGQFRLEKKATAFSPVNVLQQFEAPADEPYRMADGNEITVEVLGRPELSGRHIVGPDGKITLSVIGSFLIGGLTREEAAHAIETSYSKYYLKPAATIRVEKYTSNKVFILGRVTVPGVLTFDSPPTLLEAIMRSGGLPVGGVGAEKAALTKCAVFRGRDRVVWINLKALLSAQDLTLNIRLQRNDLIYIPDADDQLVYLLGEVRTPGAYHLTPNMTFMDAVSQAGGPTEDASREKVVLIRPDEGLRREVNLDKQVLEAKTPWNVTLNQGDIIYVPRRELARVGYVLQKMSPFSTFLLIGTFLKQF